MAKAETLFTFFSYLEYRLKAVGPHGLHSPFVFGLYNEAIRPAAGFSIPEIERLRRLLRSGRSTITIKDFKTDRSKDVRVSEIARRSLSTKKFAAFLYHILGYLQIERVLETGTNLGITTSYLASPKGVKVCTIEGNPALCDLAARHFNELDLSDRIRQYIGTLEDNFKTAVKEQNPQLVFLDAEHIGTTVIKQVDHLKTNLEDIRAIVIHDINWSKDMNRAWLELANDPFFPCSVDIFQAGILFPHLTMEKQHFVVKF